MGKFYILLFCRPVSLKKLSAISLQLSAYKQGFTLIELITAIGVLAILSAAMMAVVNPLEQFKKSADSRRKSDLAQIQRALETYYQDFGRYPLSFQSKVCKTPSADFQTCTLALEWGSSWSPYMDVIPQDPTGSQRYAYWSDNTGQSYALYAHLERGSKDPQACIGAACSNALTNGLVCGGTTLPCTYGVTSSNIAP